MSDVTALHGIQRVFHGVSMVANTVGTAVIIVLVAVLNYDVIARGVFNAPFLGAVEVVQFSVVLIVFLQLPDVVRVGRLTRSDGFLLLLAYKRPKAGRVLQIFHELISAVFMALVAIAMWPEFVEAFEGNDYFGIPGVFTAPWWPVKLVIFFSAFWCCCLFILKILVREEPTAAPKTGSEVG